MQPQAEPQAAATKLLYHADSYLRAFEAKVIAVEESALALDQTAFFPGGGGQMADRGRLVCNGAPLTLTSLSKRSDIIWHAVEAGPEGLPGVGETVTGELDWDFRYQMMRTHTALHVLCGVIFKDFGAQVTGGQMYPDRARMDFSMELFTPELVRDIELCVNEALAAD